MNRLAPSFSIGSSSYLQITKTTIISRTRSNFGQIRPSTAELAAIGRLEKSPYSYSGRNLVSSFIFDSIILILAGNKKMHKRLDEFKFRPDTTTNSAVICPGVSEKLMYNDVNTLAPSFLIRSSSFLQVRRTTIKSWTRSKFDKIRPWTAELAALERLEKFPIYL